MRREGLLSVSKTAPFKCLKQQVHEMLQRDHWSNSRHGSDKTAKLTKTRDTKKKPKFHRLEPVL